MSKRDRLLKIILPFVILAGGLVLTLVLIKLREVPHPEEKAFVGPVVEVVTVARESRRVLVTGTGTVQARYETEIVPQVSGLVDWLSPNMVAGGFFAAGETLFTIEAIDYRLALERSQAALAQADLELARIESQAAIARDEWTRLELQDNGEPNSLVLYEPQVKSALAARASAAAAIKQAELDLARTRIRAPYNCYVRDEQVAPGQYLRAGSRVATLAGTDSVEILVPLPLEELAWLQVPRQGSGAVGSPATVRIEFAGRQSAWQGEIVRALGDVDPRSRMASVVVAVTNPFGRQQQAELTPGMFVEVVLHGHELGDVFPLLRGGLRDEDTVWVVDQDNRLEIRTVEIIRRERREVLVGAGLADGDRVILSGLSGAASGMQLRPRLREDNR